MELPDRLLQQACSQHRAHEQRQAGEGVPGQWRQAWRHGREADGPDECDQRQYGQQWRRPGYWTPGEEDHQQQRQRGVKDGAEDGAES